MKKLLIATITLLWIVSMTGCADNFIRITKTGASGQYIPFATAEVEGYKIEKQGDVNGMNVTYKKADVTIVVVSKDGVAPEITVEQQTTEPSVK